MSDPGQQRGRPETVAVSEAREVINDGTMQWPKPSNAVDGANNDPSGETNSLSKSAANSNTLNTALVDLCAAGDWDGSLSLVRREPDLGLEMIPDMTSKESSLLHLILAERGIETEHRVKLVSELLSACPRSASVKNWFGSLPLHMLVRNPARMEDSAKSRILAALVEVYPVALTMGDRIGLTPLHIACDRLCPSSSELRTIVSLEKSATFVRDGRGCLAAHIAASNRCSSEAMSVLLDANPDTTARNNRGKTPLDMAMETATRQHPNKPIIKMLHTNKREKNYRRKHNDKESKRLNSSSETNESSVSGQRNLDRRLDDTKSKSAMASAPSPTTQAHDVESDFGIMQAQKRRRVDDKEDLRSSAAFAGRTNPGSTSQACHPPSFFTTLNVPRTPLTTTDLTLNSNIDHSRLPAQSVLLGRRASSATTDHMLCGPSALDSASYRLSTPEAMSNENYTAQSQHAQTNASERRHKFEVSQMQRRHDFIVEEMRHRTMLQSSLLERRTRERVRLLDEVSLLREICRSRQDSEKRNRSLVAEECLSSEVSSPTTELVTQKVKDLSERMNSMEAALEASTNIVDYESREKKAKTKEKQARISENTYDQVEKIAQRERECEEPDTGARSAVDESAPIDRRASEKIIDELRRKNDLIAREHQLAVESFRLKEESYLRKMEMLREEQATQVSALKARISELESLLKSEAKVE